MLAHELSVEKQYQIQTHNKKTTQMQIVISCEGLHTMCTLRAFFCLVLTLFLLVLPIRDP